MKRWTTILIAIFLLTGCAEDRGMDRAMEFRSRLQTTSCTFRTTVAADYGDLIHTFVVDCAVDQEGNLQFSVVAPDTIAGISGALASDGGFLTFDEELLAFSMLAEGQLSPVSAPWIMINTLRSGYLRFCSETESGYRLTIDDSYADRAMQVDVWMDTAGCPTGAEILWLGRRILTMNVVNFVFV